MNITFHRNTEVPLILDSDALRAHAIEAGIDPQRLGADAVGIAFPDGQGGRAIWFGQNWVEFAHDLAGLTVAVEKLRADED